MAVDPTSRKRNGKHVPVSLYLTEAQYEAIVQRAAATRRSLQFVLRDMIEREFGLPPQQIGYDLVSASA